VAWETTCKPKTQGGLGIIDTKSQNDALLMKLLDKFFNSVDAMGDFNLRPNSTPTHILHHKPKVLGSFGGRKYLNSLTNTRSLLSVHLTRVTQSCFG